MLDEIFLHIGMHKTGSSAIQIALNGYDDGISFYADLGKPNQSFALQTAFEQESSANDPSGRSEAERRRLQAQFLATLQTQAARPRKRMVLSAEGLCDLSDEGLLALHKTLSEYASKISVFAYIREPISFVTSYFAETIKHDLTDFEVLSPEYERRLGRFRSTFSPEDVTFRFFAPSNFTNGSLLDDFCETAGLDCDRLPNQMRANEALTLEAIQIIFAVSRSYKHLPNGYEKRRTFGAIPKAFLDHGGGQKFQLSGELLGSCIDQADIAWFENETGEHFNQDRLHLDPEGSLRSFEDLVAFRPSTHALLDEILNERGIPASDASLEQKLMKLYDSFYAQAVVPKNKRRLRRVVKSLKLWG